MKLPLIWNQPKETCWPRRASRAQSERKQQKGKVSFQLPLFWSNPFFLSAFFIRTWIWQSNLPARVGTHGPVSSWTLDISPLAWVRRRQREAWERRMSEWVGKNSLSPSSSVFSSIQLPLLISAPSSHSVHICLTEALLSGSFSPRPYIFVFPHFFQSFFASLI